MDNSPTSPLMPQPEGSLPPDPAPPPAARRPPRRGPVVLGAAAVALAAGLGGGYLWGSHNGQASAASASSSSPPSGQPGQASGQQRNGAVGEVVKVDGSTITLSTPQGDVTVTLRPDTRITKTQTGSAQDIQSGLCALANGTKNGTTVTAQTITITPPGASGCQPARGFGGGRPGGGQGSATPNPGG